MSEPEIPIYYEQISICGYFEYEEGELYSYLEEIKNIDLPDDFLNRTVDLSEENPKESEIYFGESNSKHPENVDNKILINQENEDNQLHVHIYMQHMYIETVKKVYKRIIDVLGRIDIDIITIEALSMMDFDQLDLPIIKDSDKDPNGVRYDINNRNYLLQEIPEEGLPDDEEAAVMIRMNERGVRGRVIDGEVLIEEVIEDFEEYTRGLKIS